MAALGRLGACELCSHSPSGQPQKQAQPQPQPAKYRCPKCTVVTCSLHCSNAHKQRDACDGRRDQAAFVPRSKYAYPDMINDFHLLDSIGAAVGTPSQRNLSVGLPTATGPISHSKKTRITKRTHGIKAEARKGGVLLQLMPPGMHRHQTNTTSVRKPQTPNTTSTNRNDRALHWRVEVFVDNNPQPFTFDAVCDDTPIALIAARVRHIANSIGDHTVDVPETQSVFMRAERAHPTGGGVAFWHLPQTQTLAAALRENYPPPVGAQQTRIELQKELQSASSSDEIEMPVG